MMPHPRDFSQATTTMPRCINQWPLLQAVLGPPGWHPSMGRYLPMEAQTNRTRMIR